MVCYVFNYTVIAELSIDGCFDISDEQWNCRPSSVIVATKY